MIIEDVPVSERRPTASASDGAVTTQEIRSESGRNSKRPERRNEQQLVECPVNTGSVNPLMQGFNKFRKLFGWLHAPEIPSRQVDVRTASTNRPDRLTTCPSRRD